ncbi:electron transfer flavoprotein subunit beta [Romboutsia sp.]|uniref:electron transfer flavoprotein subunit beta n=1 Tax=Romboutsia sp. TaxID=1965302 RepID=UPI003F2C19A9
MKIVVCVKQVPDTNEVQINHETGTLIREGVPSIINPDDKNAIEQALKIKDTRDDVSITVLSMGPIQADVALREALAMGVDEAILLSDRAFAGSDTWATATILAAAINKIGNYDIIFCGRQAIDGDTAQVGPEIAEFLNIPQITYVEKLEVESKKVRAHRATEEGYYVIESEYPVLLTAIKELNKPRYPRMRLIHDAYQADANLKIWNCSDIDVDLTQIGVKNSPTNVYKSFVPVREFKGTTLEGTYKEIAEQVVINLHEINLV